MNYLTELIAFYDWLRIKSYLIDNEEDYKLLLNSLNLKKFWRSKLFYPDAIYIKEWGSNKYSFSGVMPINSIYKLIDKVTLEPLTNYGWEYNQIKKMISYKDLGDKVLEYDVVLPLWQSHCRKIFRWNVAWKPAPKVILNELIPTERINIPRQLRDNIIKSCGGRCQYCGKSLEVKEIHIDHIIPVCQGGKTILKNLTVACRKCNLKKGGRTPHQANMKLI